MSTQKGISPIVIILIIVGVLVIGGGIYWWQKQKADETADWKTYRNEEYGFEVKYPESELTLMPTCNLGINVPSNSIPAERCETLIFVKKGDGYPIGPPPKSAFMFLAVHDNVKSLQLKTYIQEYLETISHPYKGEFSKEIVAGEEAYTFTYVGKGYALLDYTEKQKWMFINIGSNKVLSIENNFTVSDEIYPLFEKIISALSFNQTADWQTYRNEEYGFEIKYPDIDAYFRTVGGWTNSSEPEIISRTPFNYNECVTIDEPLPGVPKKFKLTIAGRQYCLITLSGGGAAGSGGTNYEYVSNIGNEDIGIVFQVIYPLDKGIQLKQHARSLFDQILSTFKFIE